ncbi:MAG: sel1 repeat family protein [Planctomycetaceae bacterium]|nr:sel1 repeat family protein [Planctomycetaceae bacterium]
MFDCVKYAVITNGKIQSLKGVEAKTDGGTVTAIGDGKFYWKLAEDDSVEFTFEHPQDQDVKNIKNVKIFLLSYGEGKVKIRWNGKTLSNQTIRKGVVKNELLLPNPKLQNTLKVVALTETGIQGLRIEWQEMGVGLELLQKIVAEDCEKYSRHTDSKECLLTNHPKKLSVWINAAEKNIPEGQYLYGLCYFHGIGVDKDEKEAVTWWRKAAEQNYAAAQYWLGYCYAHGTGVSKDEKEAVTWVRKAAEQNYAAAQFNLGGCYAFGTGVSKDEKEAVTWVRKAAEQNYVAAQFRLGFCYSKGTGVSKDEEEAVTWYRKAAEQNYAAAQCILGLCYAFGTGVSKDDKEAVTWLQRAEDQGHAEAKELQRQLRQPQTKSFFDYLDDYISPLITY